MPLFSDIYVIVERAKAIFLILNPVYLTFSLEIFRINLKSMKFQRWTREQAISIHCADSSRKDVSKKKKKQNRENDRVKEIAWSID